MEMAMIFFFKKFFLLDFLLMLLMLFCVFVVCMGLLMQSQFATAVATINTPYESLCNSAFCRILDKRLAEVRQLGKDVDSGSVIQAFGDKADQLCNLAIEEFAAEASVPAESQGVDPASNEQLFDKKIDELEKCLDAPLHVLYLKQLALLREKALTSFRTMLTSDISEYEAMLQADELFRREADVCTRQSSAEWSYSKELQHLKTAFAELASRGKKINEIKLTAAKQNQQAMQYLQMQQQQLQAIQQQVQGSSSPWNAALAYRVPDSNINLSVNYQQGRANVQVSCVPDESAPLLGPNGFVNGVTPGNLGLSLNLNI